MLQTATLVTFFGHSATMSPVNLAVLQIAACSTMITIIYQDAFRLQDWLNVVLSWLLFIIYFLQKNINTNSSLPKSPQIAHAHFTRIFLGFILYAAVYRGSLTFEEYLTPRPMMLPYSGIRSSIGSHNASTFSVNLSNTLMGTRDDYLGKRKSYDAVVNWKRLMNVCTDTLDGLGIEDIVNCLHYLSHEENDYFIYSNTSQTQRLYDGSQDEETPINAIRKDPVFSRAQDPFISASRSCPGQVFKFHTYWTGQATWRFELFIKGYLYTQHLACSRLWIWLDTDIAPDSIDRMLHHDALFQRFETLIHHGYMVLKPWSIPARIPIAGSGSSNEVDSTGVVREESGQVYLIPNPIYKRVSTPTQISDFVRFVVLHLHGGVYLDMDVLLLRDLRPLLLPDPTGSELDTQAAWAEQWVERAESPGDYNTAVLALPANSPLSSYLLRGGLRMGMNYHPRVLGNMLWRDRKNGELPMLHNAVFDPLVTNLRRKSTDVCTVPCHKNFKSVFLKVVEEAGREWTNYSGGHNGINTTPSVHPEAIDIESWPLSTNRSLEHFFRGAFAYHIHNQWKAYPEPNSWMDVITRAQDGFFAGQRTNVYGEQWRGPPLESYDRSKWGWL
ncbi:uncharacterized protein KY384_007008 [Bacidia gigantensis]|uniref:uncharacterized protein n=1 Tax=Bacidia gigantensis TaxID=2732470 RepID=UPI001D0571BD|nr:uncharacterized protein KY384_007008 [Bacidia gigantensis]KAG8528092.1 hypothetical protein KY384_007008 [Bacidia gigantensis]